MRLESEFAASSFAQLRTDDGLLFPDLIRQGLPTICRNFGPGNELFTCLGGVTLLARVASETRHEGVCVRLVHAPTADGRRMNHSATTRLRIQLQNVQVMATIGSRVRTRIGRPAKRTVAAAKVNE